MEDHSVQPTFDDPAAALGDGERISQPPGDRDGPQQTNVVLKPGDNGLVLTVERRERAFEVSYPARRPKSR